jgi:phage major head subunit gpT-like protein
MWPSNLVADLIANGDSNLAYDGNAFFADRSTNDNLLSGSGTTVANLQTDISTARSTMMQFESDQGRVMGLMPDTIVCPPQLETAFLEAVRAVTYGSDAGSTGIGYNPIAAFGFNVIPLPELSDANDWYIFATQYPLKPFIFQSRKAPVGVLDETEVNRNRKLYYSAEMRGNAGYGFYQMAIKVTNT